MTDQTTGGAKPATTPEPAARSDTTITTDRAPAADRQAPGLVESDEAWLDSGDAGDEEGGEGDQGDAGPAVEEQTDTPAWQRPEGLEGDALTQWKEERDLPTDAGDYEVQLGEGETISEFGGQMVDSLRELAVELDMPASTPQKLVEWYRAQEQGLRGRLAENDKDAKRATVASMRDAWGELFAANRKNERRCVLRRARSGETRGLG